MKIKSKIILILLMSASVFVIAEPTAEERQKLANDLLDKGVAAYQAGNYGEAAEYYVASIRQWGTVRAVANLCNLYLYGQGVPKDFERAKSLCEAAAQYDDSHALVMLGEIHLMGKGVPQDKEMAINYYRRGADNGHAHGQYMLGTLLLELSPEEAKAYLRKAAESGHEEAKDFLVNLSE